MCVSASFSNTRSCFRLFGVPVTGSASAIALDLPCFNAVAPPWFVHSGSSNNFSFSNSGDSEIKSLEMPVNYDHCEEEEKEVFSDACTHYDVVLEAVNEEGANRSPSSFHSALVPKFPLVLSIITPRTRSF